MSTWPPSPATPARKQGGSSRAGSRSRAAAVGALLCVALLPVVPPVSADVIVLVGPPVYQPGDHVEYKLEAWATSDACGHIKIAEGTATLDVVDVVPNGVTPVTTGIVTRNYDTVIQTIDNHLHLDTFNVCPEVPTCAPVRAWLEHEYRQVVHLWKNGYQPVMQEVNATMEGAVQCEPPAQTSDTMEFTAAWSKPCSSHYPLSAGMAYKPTPCTVHIGSETRTYKPFWTYVAQGPAMLPAGQYDTVDLVYSGTDCASGTCIEVEALYAMSPDACAGLVYWRTEVTVGAAAAFPFPAEFAASWMPAVAHAMGEAMAPAQTAGFGVGGSIITTMSLVDDCDSTPQQYMAVPASKLRPNLDVDTDLHQAPGMPLVGPSPLYPGDSLAYNVTIANHGAGDATDVQVVHTLPKKATEVAASLDGAPCPAARGKLTCTIGVLPSGGEATLEVQLTLPMRPGTLKASTAVKLGERDLNPKDNKDTLAIVVAVPQVDLAPSISFDAEPAHLGMPATVIVTVANDGIHDVPGAQLHVGLPSGFAIDAMSLPAGCNPKGKAVLCTFASPAGEATVLEFSGTPSRAGDLAFTAAVKVPKPYKDTVNQKPKAFLTVESPS